MWFGFGFVRCSTRDGSDICWRAEEAAPRIRRYVRFWTVVDILLKAVCLSRFPCPLLFCFFFFVFLFLVTPARALIAVSDHVEIISVLSSEPNLLQRWLKSREIWAFDTQTPCATGPTILQWDDRWFCFGGTGKDGGLVTTRESTLECMYTEIRICVFMRVLSRCRAVLLLHFPASFAGLFLFFPVYKVVSSVN